LGTNTCAGMILLGNSTTTPTVFTNNGTINLSGSTTTRGIDTTTYTASASTVNRTITFDNYGTINVNVNAIGTSGNLSAAWSVGNGTAVNSLARVTVNNYGTLSLTNITGTGGGSAIAVSSAGQRTNSTLNNKPGGTFSISGTAAPQLQNMIITNDGTFNTDATFSISGNTTNSSTGIINFDNAKYNLTVATAAEANIGAVYTNGGNRYTVYATKETLIGTRLVVVSDTGRAVGATGTLTKVSGTGDASIDWTASTAAALRNINTGSGTLTNNGTINSGRGSGGYLGVFAATPALVLGSTSVIAPGGNNYGFMSFSPTASPALVGTIKLQIGGNTAAGGDYDQIRTGVLDSGFNVSGAALELSGLAGLGSAASGVEIIQANGTGTITGEFAPVTGLTPGWSVDYQTLLGQMLATGMRVYQLKAQM
jgi:trimeric autotransporter adhesin